MATAAGVANLRVCCLVATTSAINDCKACRTRWSHLAVATAALLFVPTLSPIHCSQCLRSQAHVAAINDVEIMTQRESSAELLLATPANQLRLLPRRGATDTNTAAALLHILHSPQVRVRFGKRCVRRAHAFDLIDYHGYQRITTSRDRCCQHRE